MKTSEKGIALIKEFESLELSAYPDPGTGGEPYTIGWGTTVYPSGDEVMLGDTITKEEAEEYLMQDLRRFEIAVDANVQAPLNQNQFDALVSFVYNVGEANFESSTLLRRLNEKKYEAAAEQFTRWVYAGGRKLKGLIRRRQAEKELFMA